eukprot:6491775-Amphidinium_carterae.2
MEDPKHKEHVNASILGNYLKVAEICKKLQKSKSYASWSDQELGAMLERVELEKERLPLDVRTKVLQRYAENAFAKRDWSQLVPALLPYVQKPWDHRKPALAAIGASEGQALATFDCMFATTVVKPLLKRGQDGKTDLVEFLQIVAETLDEVDSLDLSTPLASSLSNVMCICQTVTALVANEVQVAKQVS